MSSAPPSFLSINDQDYFRFSQFAMNTVFEIMTPHAEKTYAAQAASEAFSELRSLEEKLSRFLPNSDISKINSSSAGSVVPIGDEAFECLAACKALAHETGGLFNISVGALLEIWKNAEGTSSQPTQEEINNAKLRMRLDMIELNADNFTATLHGDGIIIDLGGFGKGYAVNRMAEVLQEWDIESALIHGGRSSVLVYGERVWPLSISNPWTGDLIQTLQLQNAALGASGLQKGDHIINPASGYPVTVSNASWYLGSDAAVADALSTALLLMDSESIENFCGKFEGSGAFLLSEKTFIQHRFGSWPQI